jgi:hypothetical protein
MTELGLFPIEIDVKLRMISYWARLLTGKETKLSYLSYKILYNLFIECIYIFVFQNIEIILDIQSCL